MGRVTPGRPALDGAGTPEAVWRAGGPFRRLARWGPTPGPSGRTVVVAPHPDDEILGAGGILALEPRPGPAPVLVAVTDGEASHPGRAGELRRRRPAESAAAAAVLGIHYAEVHRLAHPDGAVDERRLTGELSEVLRPGDLVLAPWARDGHPDHDAVGRASGSAAAARGARRWSYLVWAWHWATPADLPWADARRVELGPSLAAAKQAAVACFTTQLAGPDPILPPTVVERLTRDFEVVLDG